MADVQVKCIKMSPPGNLHEHITHIGNPDGNCIWSKEEVIKSIERKTNSFYVVDPKTGKKGIHRHSAPHRKRAYIYVHMQHG